MIVVDTSVLSLAFRRRESSQEEAAQVVKLRRLIEEDVAIAVPGIVLQELLSGVRSIEQFNKLRDSLTGFSILLADEDHHLGAADIANRCRWSGVAASTVDCLIASMTIGSGGSLFTLDEDFETMAPLCGLGLHRG